LVIKVKFLLKKVFMGKLYLTESLLLNKNPTLTSFSKTGKELKCIARVTFPVGL
jgi:hypothetical protein